MSFAVSVGADEPKKADTTAVTTGDAKKVEAYLRELFEQSKHVNGTDAKGTKARSMIEDSLDWKRVAKDCLPPAEYSRQLNSGDKGTKNLGEFEALLKQVVMNTAFSRLGKFWDNASYVFTKMDSKDGNTHAQAKFSIKEGGETEIFILDYYLFKKKENSRWYIYDIAFEDIRYSETIGGQIKSYLGEKGFDSLLGKLRDRLKELKKG